MDLSPYDSFGLWPMTFKSHLQLHHPTTTHLLTGWLLHPVQLLRLRLSGISMRCIQQPGGGNDMASRSLNS